MDPFGTTQQGHIDRGDCDAVQATSVSNFCLSPDAKTIQFNSPEPATVLVASIEESAVFMFFSFPSGKGRLIVAAEGDPSSLGIFVPRNFLGTRRTFTQNRAETSLIWPLMRFPFALAF